MSMVTRCPACATLFRVAPQQLQARQGQVRCGRCTTVFDGFKGLATLAESAPPESSRWATSAAGAAESAVAPASAESTPARTQPEGIEITGPAEAPTLPTAPPVPSGFEFEPVAPRPARAAAQFVSPIRPATTKPESKSDSPVTSSRPVSADALFLQQAHAKRRSGSRVWTAGTILLALALAGQATYFYRGEIAANYRNLKPVMVEMCELLACDVPLPQRPRLINIEASDLQSVDPTRPGVIQFAATLRNHADYDLAYPALDLVLTNTKEHTLARRIFLPREYLEKSRDVNAGFPRNAEITIRLDLDTGQLGAAGFRLDLLPAPTH
jgi:predicted Zn finger-like uncharacterized protein